jgi:carboxypeptidase family protein
MSFTRLTASFVAAVVLASPLAAFAQSERGTITGVVVDSSKAAVPGVSIAVINIGTNSATSVVSSDSGTYSAANLPPGTYRIEATIQGFQTSKVEGIVLNAGTTARVDVTLNLGSVSESVLVVAENAVVSTEDAKVATTVSNRLIDELPLVVGGAMRSPFDLLSTVPEARGSGNTTSLGGGQGGSFGATLDGISVNTNRQGDTGETAFLTPSLEAITEFQVETNGFKPEFGQAGGGSITFASKSGTNNLSGSGYGFFRHDSLDKKGYFEQTKGIYKQSDVGGSLGGPLTIPNLYSGRNRTFFFVSYEGFYNKQGSNAAFRSVPTPEMWDGDFSNWVNASGQRITIYDPATTRVGPTGALIRDPFPNNRIPADRFSTTAKQYIALARSVLVPNQGGAPGTFGYVNNNYASEGKSTIETTNKYSLKVDHTLSNTNRVAYVFNRTRNGIKAGPEGASGLPAPFSDFSQNTFDGDLHRASWDWVGASMVNHLTVGANTFNKNAFSPNVDQNWKDKVCIKNAVDCNQNFGAITFSEFSSWGATSYNGTKQPRFTVKDDITFIKGSHTIKTGFTYDRQQANGFGQQDYGGRAGFDFKQTGVPGVTNFATAGGSSFASFLIGYANSGRTETIRYLQQIYPYYGFYAQDDWRMNEKFVLNYGVRYEFTRPPVAGGDQYSELDPTKPNPAVNGYPGALIFAGEGEGREGKRSLVKGYYGAIAPRLSGAYSINNKTTLRGGVGRSYGRVTVISGTSHFAGFIGQYEFTNGDNGVTPTFLLDQGIPAYPLPPQINPSFANNLGIDYWNGDAAMRPATYDTWTLSMQRELMRGMTFEVDYNGSKGSNLQANLLNINQVPLATVNDLIARLGPTAATALLSQAANSPAAVAAGIKIPYANFTNPAVQRTRSVAQALRPFPQYGTINTTNSGGDKTGKSMYHAAVFKLTQRLSAGLLFQGSYTLSKLMTDADVFSGSTGSMDTAQPELEYSIGRLDQTHVIKLNTVVELPFGPGRRWLNDGVASHILGGWRVAAVQSYSSGLPIGVTGPAPLAIFNGTNRPNVTGAPWRPAIAGDEFNPRVDRYLDRAAFVAPVAQLGNAPRINGDVRRPWNMAENMSIAKTISMTGQVRMDVRLEAFNLLNRVIWGAPASTDFTNNNFGLINSTANSPRQLQLGLKLYW